MEQLNILCKALEQIDILRKHLDVTFQNSGVCYATF